MKSEQKLALVERLTHLRLTWQRLVPPLSPDNMSQIFDRNFFSTNHPEFTLSDN